MNETTQESRLAQAFAKLSDRERVLLGVMFVVLGSLAAIALTYVSSQRMAELQDEIDAKRTVLTELTTQRDDYLRNAARNAEIREQVRTANLRLSTFIEGRARAARLPTPREFSDNTQPLDGGVTLVTSTAQFASVELEQLEDMMRDIETSDELVFTRNLSVSPASRGADGMQVEVTLSTYRRSSGDDE